MTIHTSNFGELLWPGIKLLFGHKYKKQPTLYTKFVQMESSDKAFEKYQGVTTLGLAVEKTQGGNITFADPTLGYQGLITNVSYGLATGITREMYDDDQYGYVRKVPGMLAEAVRKTEETVAHNLLNNGFTSGYNTADGVTIFSTSHKTMDGSATFQNTPTTSVDLSQTALENAEILIAKFVDEKGLPIVAKGVKLVVPVDSRFIAEKILKTSKEVDTANNTINPMSDAYSLIVSPYITDADSWFIITDVPDGLIFQRRTETETDKDGEFTTLNMRFSVYTRFGAGVVNPRGVFGCAGA
jgi:phage major head subunit gpT-like protein